MLVLNLTLALAGILAAIASGAPTEASSGGISASTHNRRSPTVSCGQFTTMEGIGPVPVYANGHYENVDLFEHMDTFDNWSCGICMVFRERDAHGDVLWSGGPNQGAANQLRGAQSYYCITGALPPRAIGVETVKKNEIRDCEQKRTIDTRGNAAPLQTCGHYWDDRHCHPQDVLANGHYENVATNTIMNGFTNDACGICMVFRGRDATGDEMWWGGPGTSVSKQVNGAQSYYCVYGDIPPKPLEARGEIDVEAMKNLVRRKAAVAREVIAARKAVDTSAVKDLIKILNKTLSSSSTKSPAIFCGNYTAVIPGVEEQVFSIIANEHYENTIDHAVMTSFSNQECGFCVVFKGPDCTGDEMFWGGPGDHTNDVKGAQSYFCY